MAWVRIQKEFFVMLIKQRRKRAVTFTLFMPSRPAILVCPFGWTSGRKYSLKKSRKHVSVLPICNEELGPRRQCGSLSALSRTLCLKLLADSMRMS